MNIHSLICLFLMVDIAYLGFFSHGIRVLNVKSWGGELSKT